MINISIFVNLIINIFKAATVSFIIAVVKDVCVCGRWHDRCVKNLHIFFMSIP